MANVSIARRYARALIDVGASSNKLDKFSEQLEGFVQALQVSRELNDVMVNPAYSRGERSAVVDAVMQTLGSFEPEVKNFLNLLVDRNRVVLLPDIARIYRDLADARAGRIRGKVTSAVALPPNVMEQITKLLATLTQQTVVLESKVDPNLIGGVSAQVGSVVYDGSVRSQLEQMRRQLS